MIIKVDLFSLKEKTIILMQNDENGKSIKINGENSDYNPELFQFRLISMSRDWPEKLEDTKTLDGISYKVVIKDKDFKKIFEFKNLYPNNIHELYKLINEVKSYENNRTINK